MDKFFKITERGSTIGQEVRGGVVTFFTMAYIIVLNPLILGFVPDVDGNLLGGEGPGNLAAPAVWLDSARGQVLQDHGAWLDRRT